MKEGKLYAGNIVTAQMDCSRVELDEFGLFRERLEPITITNADRIRAMTDEELARFIALQRAWYCDYKDPTEEEYPKALEYLRREASDSASLDGVVKEV